MTNWMTKTMLATATLAVAAGVASAQSMSAEIPFAFHAAGKKLAPGTYRVSINNTGAPTFRLINDDTGTGVLLLPGAAKDPAKELARRGKPALSFDCSDDGCYLAEVWTATGRPAYQIRHPRLRAEDLRVAYVALRPEKGD